MKFLVDSMLPPQIAVHLEEIGHDAVTPAAAGAHNLPDDVLIGLASVERRVIVTENASDFAGTTACTVLLVRKSWWPSEALAPRIAAALDRWAAANADPGSWAQWLEAEFR